MKQTELTAIEDILSRTTLIHTPRDRLKDYLESIYNEKMTDNMLEVYFKSTLSSFFIKIPQNEKFQDHYLQLIFKLLKLGIKAKLHKFEALASLKDILTYVPYVLATSDACDPLLHLMETLPLVDYGSNSFYHEQNLVRYSLINSWIETAPYGGRFENHKIPSLPYVAMKAACDFAHQFKLITCQYIENKATKEEFQLEIQSLSSSANEQFKSRELKGHEDPGLICIEDLSYLLKFNAKRKRLYEAFHYILKQRPVSSYILNQQTYLEIRQKVEDQILSKAKLLEKNKIVYSQLLKHFTVTVLDPLFKSGTLQNLHIQDPILDALESDSLPPFVKMELKHAYCTIQPLNDQYVFNLYIVQTLTSNIAFDLAQIQEKDMEAHLMNRSAILTKLKNSLSNKVVAEELNLILKRAGLTLSEENVRKLIAHLERSLSMKIPYNIQNI